MENYTQQQKIVALMIKRKDEQQWFYAPDFMKENLDKLFVGYEASARLSNLSQRCPAMVESRKRSRYIERRIRWETMNNWFYNLPKEIKSVFQNFSMYPDKIK